MAFGGFGSNSGPRGPPEVQPQFGKVFGSTSPQFGFNNDGPPQQSPRLEAQTGVLFDNVGSTAPKRGHSPPLIFGGNPSAVAPSYPPYEARRAHLSPQRMEVPPLAFESSYSVKDYHKPFEEPRSGSHNVEIGPLTEFSKFQAPPQRTRSPPLPSSSKVHLGNSHPTANQGGRVAVSPPKLGNRSNLLEKNASLQNQHKSSLLSRNIDAEDAKAKFMNSQVPKRARSPSPPSTNEVLLGNSYPTEVDSEREMQAKAKRLARFSVELSQPVQTNHDQMTHKFSGNRNDKPLVCKFVAEQPSEAAGDSMLTDYEGLESSSVIIGLCPDMCPEPEREERERKGDLDKYERFDGDRNLTSKSLAVKKYNRMAEREADLIRPMPVLQKTMDYLLALLDQPYDASFLGMYNFLWDRMRAIRMDLRMQHIFNQYAITMLEQMIRLHIIAMHELCEYTKGEGFSEGFDAHLNIEQMNKTSVELFQMYDDHKKNGIGVSSEKEFRGYYALLKLDRHPGYKVEPAELSLDLAKMTSEMRQTPEILFARDVARACRTGNFIAFFRLARKATYLQACLMHAHFAKLRTQALASLHSGLQINQGIPISHVAKWMGVEGDEIENLLEYHGFLIKEFEEPYMVKEGPFLNSDKDYCTKCSQLVHMKKSKKIFKDVIATDVLVQAKQVFSAKIDKYDQTKQAFSAKIDKRDHTKHAFSTKIDKCEPGSVHLKAKTMVHADEEMADFARDSTSVDDSQVHPIFEIPLTPNQRVESDHQVAEVGLASSNVPSVHHFPQPTPAKVGKVSQMTRQTLRNDSLEKNIQSSALCIPQETMAVGAPQICSSESEQSCFESVLVHSAPQRVAIESLATGETTTSILNIEEEEALIHQEKENEDDIAVQQKNEAATAKLKLIMRIWKRRSLKRRELREQRQLAASAALSSLSLGPVIGHINTELSHVIELDIDQAMRERRERQERSWSRLNVSRVIAGILSRRNPDAKCLCWKLIVCSKLYSMEEDMLGHRNQVNSSAGRWLSSKLMGVGNENGDELEFSSPGLSIWKSWASSDYGSSSTCCLSVVRQIKCDKLDDTVNGVSAILFLASERVPLELQKTQLHNILMLLPSGSQLPLLVVSDTYKEEMLNPPTTIIDGLGLHFIDKTRVSSFTVVSLVENHLPGHLEGFFSNDRLVEGLEWLASRSRVQPVLCCVKTRDLVMDHLNSSLELLENMDASIVGPNHCISAFNEALVQSSEKVATVVDKNPAMWPCPEIDLLKFSLEHKVAKSFLPSVGWSSIEKIKPIVNAIQGCALPIFPDLSWLNGGSDMGKEIPNQKSELEKCLAQYLVDSSKMMDWALAAREVSVMLQKGAQLQLHGQKYRIVPRWVAIFKRIFHWRLMSLTTGATSVAYVLESEGKACKKPCEVTPVKFGARDFSATPTSPSLSFEGGETPALPQLSLDEMVEVCCSPIVSGREQLELRVVQPLTGIANKLNEAMGVASACENMEDNEKLREEESFAETGDALLSDCHLSKGTMVVASNEKKEYDRLQKLLVQCNMLQDMIDDKLSIYF